MPILLWAIAITKTVVLRPSIALIAVLVAVALAVVALLVVERSMPERMTAMGGRASRAP